MALIFLSSFVLSFVLPILSFPPLFFDCSFEQTPPNFEEFCAWRPDNVQSARLWHNGDAVLVDAANALVHSADGGNRFAYAQGHFGSPTEGSLRSPFIVNRLELPGELTLSYWKASASPSLDICVEEDGHEPVRCVDTIQGPGQSQWVRRAVELPKAENPFRVVLRARNLLSAEDFVGVDDIRLLNAEDISHHLNAVDNNGISIGDTVPKNPFDRMGEEETEQGQKQLQPRKDPMQLAQQTKTEAIKQLKDKHQQQQHSPIRPQIRLFPSTTQPTGSSSRPSKTNDQSHDPPIPSNDQLSLFSFNRPKLATAVDVQKAAEEDHCPAVSCSFMEGNCLWQLDPGWHNNSQGSLSVQSPVQSSQMISAMFTPAVTSSVDFDLFMSDDTEITVIERHMGKADKGSDILLFSRHGATDGGWHRFRVPLRPSFSPVRLLFLIKIEEELLQAMSVHNFVSISNVKLVNGDGNEISCETIGEPREADTRKMPSPEPMPSHPSRSEPTLSVVDNLFGMHQPTPLQLPSQFPLPSSLLVVPPPSFHSQFIPPPPSPPVGLPSTPFNPFSPMFEGILPIVPLRVNPPRLTALMDAPIQQQNSQTTNVQLPLLSSPLETKERALLMAEENENVVTRTEHQPQGLLPIGTKNDDERTLESLADESLDSAERKRHQLKRVIRPESYVREVAKNPQLVVLMRERKWGRGRGQMNKVNADEGQQKVAHAGWPVVEMGAGGGEKRKDEKEDKFRRKHLNN